MTTDAGALRVGELWRYPVKSLHGEQLDHAHLDVTGMVGDRIVHVADDHGVTTGRTHGDLLRLRATTGAAGRPLVEGHRWDSPAAAALVHAVAGDHTRLAAYDGPERFDVLPLLVATDAEITRLGVDRRRLRPNIVVRGALPEQERAWPGFALRIGPQVVIGVDSIRLRCVVTTVDPDTGVRDRDVLRRIHREFASRTALNCWVIRGGSTRTGDSVTVEPLPAANSHDPYLRRPTSWIAGGSYPFPTGTPSRIAHGRDPV